MFQQYTPTIMPTVHVGFVPGQAYTYPAELLYSHSDNLMRFQQNRWKNPKIIDESIKNSR